MGRFRTRNYALSPNVRNGSRAAKLLRVTFADRAMSSRADQALPPCPGRGLSVIVAVCSAASPAITAISAPARRSDDN